MDLPVNSFKHALSAGRPQIGVWNFLCSAIVSEILSNSGFDWVLIDTEHAPNELPMVLQQLQAMQSGSASPVVRVAWNDRVMIKRVLDIGAQSLLLPYIQSGEEAKEAVASMRYPPEGKRGVAGLTRAAGYGRIKDYIRNAASELCLLLQVESRQGMANIDAIASVEGVDGIFIGPSDLSTDMGHFGNWRHPEVWAAIEGAAASIRKAGKVPGILIAEADAQRCLDMGYLFVAVASDVGLLRQGDAIAAKFKRETHRSS